MATPLQYLRRIWAAITEPDQPARIYPLPKSEPSDWCLVGNIVDEHPFGQEGEIRRGTRHFRPGTKVYCLPPQWGDGYESVITIGKSRGSRKWITVVTPHSRITNWRPKVIYNPTITKRLRQGYQGFKRQWISQEEVEGWVRHFQQKSNSLTTSTLSQPKPPDETSSRI